MPPLPCGRCVLPSELVVQLKMDRSARGPLTRPLPQVRFSNNLWHVDTNLKDFNVFPYCFKFIKKKSISFIAGDGESIYYIVKMGNLKLQD